MKDYLADLVRGAPAQGRNLAREYLQARLLAALQHAGAMVPLAFQGGSALRFLFSTQRFSEELDFALEGDRALCDLTRFLGVAQSELAAEGYPVELKVSDQRAIHSAFVRFPGLLYDLGLSAHRNAVLAVKIEVDTDPPRGAGLATSLVRRYVTLRLQHHDRASLLAGKLHAVLSRAYTKGRDIYDLLWYLTDRSWPTPNLVLLNNALRQTGWTGEAVDEHNWRGLVRERLQALDWERAVEDVRPFVEAPDLLPYLTLEHLSSVLEQYR